MTCKEIAKLLSEKQDRGLPWSQRMMIRIHLTMCVFCRRLEKHFGFIHSLSEAAGGTDPDSPLEPNGAHPGGLSPEAKARIKTALTQQV